MEKIRDGEILNSCKECGKRIPSGLHPSWCYSLGHDMQEGYGILKDCPLPDAPKKEGE